MLVFFEKEEEFFEEGKDKGSILKTLKKYKKLIKSDNKKSDLILEGLIKEESDNVCHENSEKLLVIHRAHQC
jgi:uncharacterized protein YktA (UPF0223 family)